VFSVTAQDIKKETPESQIVKLLVDSLPWKGYGCELAVRLDGKPYYFVDGTSRFSWDAHAADGFCSVVKSGVTGSG
jgi:hypothetical protein